MKETPKSVTMTARIRGEGLYTFLFCLNIFSIFKFLQSFNTLTFAFVYFSLFFLIASCVSLHILFQAHINMQIHKYTDTYKEL